MNISDMTLKDVVDRLAELDVEVREATDVETVDKATQEKTALLERKAELEAIEQRKAAAAALSAGTAVGRTIEKGKTTMEQNKFAIDSVEYRNAWLKNLKGEALTMEERAGITSADGSGAAAIPTLTMNKVIAAAGEVAPIMKEIDLLQIPGNVTIPVEATAAEAAIHTENAAITASDDTLLPLALTGYEIVKLIPISAKMEMMSIDAFEDWIVKNITMKIMKKAAGYVINGDGSGEPSGIDAAATWVDQTNAVDWASSAPTLAEVQEQISYLDSDYAANAKWLMNFKTFWTCFHPLRDDKKPEIINGTMKDGYLIFGFPVIIDPNVVDGDAFFGDFNEAVHANFAAPIAVEASRISGFRSNSTDYRGACIFDSKALAGGRIVKGAATL